MAVFKTGSIIDTDLRKRVENAFTKNSYIIWPGKGIAVQEESYPVWNSIG